MKIFITLVYCQVSQQYKYTERLASVDHAVFGTVCSKKIKDVQSRRSARLKVTPHIQI